MMTIVLAACSGGAAAPTGLPSASPVVTTTGPASPGASPGASATVVPVSTAPATFTLTVVGDANVTGTWSTSFGITCQNPTFDGPDILFFAQSPDAKAVVLITLRTGSIGVSERAGQGATFTDREFQGTGVQTFDPSTGATFDADLTIVPTPGSNPGTLGTITHVSGKLDCGNQAIGASTVTASGSTPDGSVSGPFSAFRVTCNASTANGNSVSTTAIITAGSNPTLLIIALPANHNATIFTVGKSPATNHSYTIDPAGTYTTTATGAHVDADFVEVLPSGQAGTPARFHLVGDLSCGTFNKTA